MVVARYPVLIPPALTLDDTVSPPNTMVFLAVGIGEHNLTIRVENVVPAEASAGNDALSNWMQVLPARTPPPPPPPDGVRIEALATLGFGAFVGFLFAFWAFAQRWILIGQTSEVEVIA